MRIMRRRDIDDIHRRIRTDLFKTCKYILHTVFLCKSYCFLLRPVHDTIQFLPSFFHSLCQFIGNDTAACTHPVCHLFSPFLSTYFILIHFSICFIYDLADIHTTAYCPAHGTGDWHLTLSIPLKQCCADRFYHGFNF